jgi:glutaminase
LRDATDWVSRPFISTGHLPDAATVEALLTEAHERFASNTEGVNSDVYPALTRVAPGLFGICLAAANGAVFEAGDTGVEFSIMSVSKPFVFALVCRW